METKKDIPQQIQYNDFLKSEVLTLGLPDEAGQVVLLESTVNVPNGGRLF